MNTTLKTLAFGAIVAGFLTTMLTCGAPAVRADDLPLTVTIGPVSVTPGETSLAVDGEILNTTNNVVDSDVASESVPFAVSIDDSDFYSNTPYPFMPGQDSGVVELFMFDISTAAAPGDYEGTFTISQADANSPTGYDVVGLGTFNVDIVGGTAPVPEPSSQLLLLLGLIGIGWWSLQRLRIPRWPASQH
jgi:hypothetical protein